MQAARVAFLFSVTIVASLRAQAPAYDSVTLGCGRFRELVRGTLQGNLGGEARTEQVGRDGVLEVRAVPVPGAVSLEAWYDSLSVYREGPEGRFEPDASGMIGGRYRGRLDPRGGYEAEARPFVPEAVGEVFDLSGLMGDFLPLLPPGPLRPGGEWRRLPGETIWRLADSATGEGPIERYRWARRSERTDTLRREGPAMPVLRREAEEGSLRWRPGTGPVGWRRTIRAEALLQAGAAGRTSVTQDVTVVRLSARCPPASR